MCLTCPICLDLLCSGSCQSLQCGHIFHVRCMAGIVRCSSRGQKICPYCRQPAHGLRKIFVTDEICMMGNEYQRMKRQLEERVKESEEYKSKYESMCRKYSNLEERCKQKEIEWFLNVKKENCRTLQPHGRLRVGVDAGTSKQIFKSTAKIGDGATGRVARSGILKGVRTNRSFELLIQYRAIPKNS